MKTQTDKALIKLIGESIAVHCPGLPSSRIRHYCVERKTGKRKLGELGVLRGQIKCSWFRYVLISIDYNERLK